MSEGRLEDGEGGKGLAGCKRGGESLGRWEGLTPPSEVYDSMCF